MQYQSLTNGEYVSGLLMVVLTMLKNELLRESRTLTPLMALRLSRLFGNTPEFWLNAQRAYDLWQAQQAYQAEINKIQPLKAA